MALGYWIAIAGGLAVLAGAGVVFWLIPRRRITPAEREQRRRLKVSSHGRIASATITDFHNGIISYTYTVGGVEHSATQDLSALAGSLPDDPGAMIAQPASLKYLPGNPANSILAAEDWCGLHFRPSGNQTDQGPSAPAGGIRNSAE
jgi:hypothetical protein